MINQEFNALENIKCCLNFGICSKELKQVKVARFGHVCTVFALSDKCENG